MLDRPVTNFVSVEDSDVAYQVFGEGETDLLIMAGSATNVDVWWDNPEAAQLWRDLGRSQRIILFDRRGAGASERLGANSLPGWQGWVLEALTVLDAVGSGQAFLMGVLDAGPVAMQLAAKRPDRVAGLVLVRTAARLIAGDGYDHGHSVPDFDLWCAKWRQQWGTEAWVRTMYPDAKDPRFIDWSVRYQRACYSARIGVEFMRQWSKIDVRGLLPDLTVPTMVIGRREVLVDLDHARYLAENITDARLVEIAGQGGLLDVVAQLREPLLDFVGKVRTPEVRTVLFTDMVGSTEAAIGHGNDTWAQMLDRYDLAARVIVARHRGSLVKSTGDGSLAVFDDTACAVMSAIELVDETRAMGLDIRAGLHRGPVISRGDDIGGTTVHAAARIMATAPANGVVVSDSVVNEVGDTFHLGPPALVTLRGFPEPITLHSVISGGNREGVEQY